MPKLRERKAVEEPKEKLCNTYGEVIGVKVGMVWEKRAELSNSGVHRRSMSKLHCGPEGAYSLLLSSEKDAHDDGSVIIYYGNGNESNYATETYHSLMKSEKSKLPLRVVRSHKIKSAFAPKTGFRYDGLYTVVECWLRQYNNGNEYRFKIVRCKDQEAPPWKEVVEEEKDSEPQIVISRHIRIQGQTRASVANKPKQEPVSECVSLLAVRKKRDSREDDDEEEEEEEEEGRSEEDIDVDNHEELVEMGEIVVLREDHEGEDAPNLENSTPRDANEPEQKVFRKGWDGCCEFVDCAEKKRLRELRQRLLAKAKAEGNGVILEGMVDSDARDPIKGSEVSPDSREPVVNPLESLSLSPPAVDPFGDTPSELPTPHQLPVISRTVSFATGDEESLHQLDSFMEGDPVIGRSLSYDTDAFRQVVLKPILVGSPPQVQFVTVLGQTDQEMYTNSPTVECLESTQYSDCRTEEGMAVETPNGVLRIVGVMEANGTPGPSEERPAQMELSGGAGGVESGMEGLDPPEEEETFEDDIEVVTSEDEVKVCFEKKLNILLRPPSSPLAAPQDTSMLDMSLRDLFGMLRGNLDRNRTEGQSQNLGTLNDSERSRLTSLLSVFSGTQSEETVAPSTSRATGSGETTATTGTSGETTALDTSGEIPAPGTSGETAAPGPSGSTNHVCCSCVTRKDTSTTTTVDVGTQCDPVEIAPQPEKTSLPENNEDEINPDETPARRKYVRTKQAVPKKRKGAEHQTGTVLAPSQPDLKVVKLELDMEHEVLFLPCQNPFESYSEEWARPHAYSKVDTAKSFDQICEELCRNIPENVRKSKMKKLSSLAHDNNHLIMVSQKEAKRVKKKRRRKLPQEGFNGFTSREMTRARVCSARHYGQLIEYSDFHGWSTISTGQSYLASGRLEFY